MYFIISNILTFKVFKLVNTTYRYWSANLFNQATACRGVRLSYFMFYLYILVYECNMLKNKNIN